VIYVLDACAMVAYLNGEPGGDVVEKALLEQDSECLAHAINHTRLLFSRYWCSPSTVLSRDSLA
jgi:PIN domain nuclease of toxin-antitoxin system